MVHHFTTKFGRLFEAAHARKAYRKDPEIPTIFHLTHPKAGSQWIASILRCCAPQRCVEPELANFQLLTKPIRQGCIYPAVYLPRREFEGLRKPGNSQVFIVVRDLRDTLVSAYYSFKVSHPEIDPLVKIHRTALNEMDSESGLLYLIDRWLPSIAETQRSWVDSGYRIIKYEDSLTNDVEILGDVLAVLHGPNLSKEDIEKAILANRFSAVTAGRKNGLECESSHQRKGIAGDWKNYFTPNVKSRFKDSFGRTLILLGYETGLRW
jgi:lipopolysaccharide transport system ATP-binding protein